MLGRLEGEQLVGDDIQGQRQQEFFWREEPDLSTSIAKPWELQEVPWKPVTDIRDWKELIQKKVLPSTRTSVKICVSYANHPTYDEVRHGFITVVNPSLIQVKASHASDKRAVDVSSQTSNVPSASNTTHASSSIHLASRDTNLEVPPSHIADTRFLPKAQAQTTALAPVLPNEHAHGSQPIAATSSPMPIPLPTPTLTSLLAHARAPPITVTPLTMTLSPSPLLGHRSELPATLESRKNVSSPQTPTTPSLSLGANLHSELTSVTSLWGHGLHGVHLSSSVGARIRSVIHSKV